MIPMETNTHTIRLARIALLQAERAAEARGERVHGHPARSFEAIQKEQKA